MSRIVEDFNAGRQDAEDILDTILDGLEQGYEMTAWEEDFTSDPDLLSLRGDEQDVGPLWAALTDRQKETYRDLAEKIQND